ncbi:MAG: hypothetical protein DLM73_10015 [Chthoniobacterales bacterium]|nr:MAG: hypothetical protein DLM73_10015 [Chthoniobacterales bacterium]
MSDPRNVAHAKKVTQEKDHEQAKSPATAKQKSRKAKPAAESAVPASAVEPAKSESAAPGELERSLAVLSKLKDMEFHSRANIEALAELTLTIEDELKQKEFVEPIGALYSAQDGFHTKIAALIASYEAKCESLKESPK